MKRKIVYFLTIISLIILVPPCWAQEKATAEEVYQKTIDAVTVLSNLGDAGLPAFNDPNGEFVWKDSYVVVINCETDAIAAHIAPNMIGAKMGDFQCLKTKKYVFKDLCQTAGKKGKWVEYWYYKRGEEGMFRKVVFALQTGKYLVMAGIYHDTLDIDKLNSQLK
jgi:cytochrome c